MDFQFYMPVKVIFGQDAMSQFASLAKEPVLIVSTEILTQLGVTGKVAAACGGSPAVYDQVEANPTLSTVEAIASAIPGAEHCHGGGGRGRQQHGCRQSGSFPRRRRYAAAGLPLSRRPGPGPQGVPAGGSHDCPERAAK